MPRQKSAASVSDRRRCPGGARIRTPRTWRRPCGVCRPPSSKFRLPVVVASILLASAQRYSFFGGEMRTRGCRRIRPAGDRRHAFPERRRARFQFRVVVERGAEHARHGARADARTGDRQRAASAGGARGERRCEPVIARSDAGRGRGAPRRCGRHRRRQHFSRAGRRFASTRRSKISRAAASSERRPCAEPTCLRSWISSPAEIRDVVGFEDARGARRRERVVEVARGVSSVFRSRQGGVERPDGRRRKIVQGGDCHRSVVCRGISPSCARERPPRTQGGTRAVLQDWRWTMQTG